MAEIKSLPISSIDYSKTNPRQTLDKAADQDLLQSIKEKGVLEKILVRPTMSGRYELVDGARRLRTARETGLTEILAEVREMTDAQVVEYQLISFLQRAGLHPLDEAQAYSRLQKQNHLDVAAIAKQVGKTGRYVAERLQLTKLITPAKDALSAGKISLDHALLIGKLQPDAQSQALKACQQRWRPMTVKDLKEWIEEQVHLDLESAPFPREDKDLLPKAGPCSSCPKRAGNNPDLFGDAKKNTCTDRSCFNAKVKAWTDREIERVKSEGKQIKRISHSSYGAPTGALSDREYSVLSSSKAEVFGLYVDGPNRGMLTGIRLKSEKAPAGSGDSGRKLSKEELKNRYKRRVEIFETRIEQEARNRLFKALLARTKWPLSRKEFELLIPELFKRYGSRFWQYELDRIEKATGIKLPKEGNNFGDRLYKIFPKLTDQQLAQLALAIVMSNELIDDPSIGSPDDDRFKVLLSIHKQFDRKALTKKVAEEMESKRPKPPKVEKEKKPVKKGKSKR